PNTTSTEAARGAGLAARVAGNEARCWVSNRPCARLIVKLAFRHCDPKAAMHARRQAWIASSACGLQRRSTETLSALHIILLAKVVADLHDHCDAFGIAGLGLGRRIGLGAEFPGVPVRQNRNRDSVRTVGVNLQLRPCHCNEFGFALCGLAHESSFLGDSR